MSEAWNRFWELSNVARDANLARREFWWLWLAVVLAVVVIYLLMGKKFGG